MIDPRSLSLDPKDWIKTKADQVWLDAGGYIDPTEFFRICDFCKRCLVILDGPNAGKPFMFLEWFLVSVLFPAVSMYNADGKRRYKRGAVFCPKKVGKTTSLAAWAIAEVCLYQRAEIYIMSSGMQALRAMWKAISDFVNTSPILAQPPYGRKNPKLPELNKSLKQLTLGQSNLNLLSGDKQGKSGHNIRMCVIDETCEIQDVRSVERMGDGAKWREDNGLPYMCPLNITTPLYDRNSYVGELYDTCRAIQTGNSLRTDFLAVIHGLPPDVDWRDENNWWKYLAGLGDVINKDVYRQEYARRIGHPREMIAFRNYYLCTWAESLETWLPIEKIDGAMSDFSEESLHKQRCYIGIDGAVNQLGAYALFFPDTMQVIMRFFHPRVTAERSDAKLATNLIAWDKQYIDITPGDMFDWPIFRDSLLKDCQTFDVLEIGFDPLSLESRAAELASDLPCRVVPVHGTPSHVLAPTKHFERLILAGELGIKTNDCMRWNMKNAVVRIIGDSPFIDRNKSTGRYDGCSALIIALNRYLANLSNGRDAEVILL